MDTRARGDTAETAILHSLTMARMPVLTPFGRFGPYDLVVETAPGAFVRIQVKSGRVRAGCIEFNCVGTDHGRGRGSYAGRADVFAFYLHATGEQFVVPVAEARASKMYLRISPTRNGQAARVRMACDYRLGDWVASVRGFAADGVGAPVTPRGGADVAPRGAAPG